MPKNGTIKFTDSEVTMPDEYNKELCEERHENIKEGFDRAFLKMGNISKTLNRFLLLTISTLIAVILNIVITFANNGR